MILFTILLLMFIILMTFGILVVSIGGAIAVVLFGDVFVCAAIIAVIMVFLCKRKRRKREL